MNILQLPTDILAHIYSFLSARDMSAIMCTCRATNTIQRVNNLQNRRISYTCDPQLIEQNPQLLLGLVVTNRPVLSMDHICKQVNTSLNIREIRIIKCDYIDDLPALCNLDVAMISKCPNLQHIGPLSDIRHLTIKECPIRTISVIDKCSNVTLNLTRQLFCNIQQCGTVNIHSYEKTCLLFDIGAQHVNLHVRHLCVLRNVCATSTLCINNPANSFKSIQCSAKLVKITHSSLPREIDVSESDFGSVELQYGDIEHIRAKKGTNILLTCTRLRKINDTNIHVGKPSFDSHRAILAESPV